MSMSYPNYRNQRLICILISKDFLIAISIIYLG